MTPKNGKPEKLDFIRKQRSKSIKQDVKKTWYKHDIRLTTRTKRQTYLKPKEMQLIEE